MAQPQASDLDFQSASRIVNLLDPTVAQHAATKAYVDSAVEGLAWKDSVRAASVANITIASPGAAIDGVTMAAADRFLAKDQTAGAENGIYVWNGAATPATRALDMNSAAEVEQAITTVEEGTTNAATTWRQTAVNVTLGTTTLTWVAFGTAAPSTSTTVQGVIELATQAEVDAGTDTVRAVTPQTLANYAGRVRKVAANKGDGSTTSIAYAHNLNTTDVQAQVWETGGSKRQVNVEIQITDANTVTAVFTTAPATNAVRFVVMG